MSRKSDRDRRRLAPPRGYEVGYGKPPEHTRFRPGQSGNPKGRPKGSKNKTKGMRGGRLEEIILGEAYRGIAVNDGDRIVTIPTAQAVMRSIAINAAKGRHRSQGLFAALLSSVERSRKAQNDELLQTAIEYMTWWENELRRRKVQGITNLPDPLPHPDHIEIDFVEGTARIIGPMTKEEKAAFDQLAAKKDRLVDELLEIDAAIQAESNPKKRRKLEELREQKAWVVRLIFRLERRNEGGAED